MKTGIIILAAGSSSRLGKPKQLLSYKDKSLINIVSDAAFATAFTPVIVVLGANAELISKNLKLDYIINDSWHEGISASIAAGMSAILEKEPDLEDVILAVSDQPFINAEIFARLYQQKISTGKGIIASRYAQTTGTPVLFNKRYFPQLLALQENSGAKPILNENRDDTETIDFEHGHIDIDTETDYNNLIKD
ncbi:nucleotidyltransferase family protein [Pedobacter chinensis]|uniref:Nucleotidyltransferase family protein n=1 Tax=Pedobacter chinensis TaxID=2282421 RepID=A0A369Q6N5_9SPHI|nr:nucleotidyltransferase family protein [Pedobacter chinensis]RDC57958.1 nucleotidyltransferase family protein [Pedobacter chinensis]